jgi:CMP-N,N'-diacetyllegionaminic acid synthase
LSKDTKILWLVAARAGSKSVPNKNIQLLNGIPLLGHRILRALKTNYPNDVWISTDSTEYAHIAQRFGAQVKFLRPEKFAQDNSNSIDVVLHAMRFAEDHHYKFDFIGLLEPTSPFITEKHLNGAIHQLLNTSDAEGIVAVKVSRPNTIFIQDDDQYLETLANNLNNIKQLNRQQFKKQITPSGGFYIARWDSFMENSTFYTSKTLRFLVDDFSALEIDEPIDFLFAEFLTARLNNEENNL